MGKITVTLDDDIEKQLRSYVTKNYPEKPFGKLSEIVGKAVKQFLAKNDQ